MGSSKLITRFKRFFRRGSSNANDGRPPRTHVPPKGASSPVAGVSQCSPSPDHQETSCSRKEQPQAAGSNTSTTPDQALITTVPPTLPSPRTTTLRRDAEQSLWNRAYEALYKKDRPLMVRYEKLLSKELSEDGTSLL